MNGNYNPALVTKVQYARLYFRNLDDLHISFTLIGWA
jgi:hypothetical protein